MVKSFAASAVLLASVFGATLLTLAACSSTSDDSKFAPDPPKPDGEADTGGRLLGDTGTSDGGEGGVTTCTAQIPDNFKATWKAPVRAAGACSTQDLKDYYAACLLKPEKTEGDGTCAAFKTAHATCAACAEPTDNSGPIQWHATRAFYTLNVAACIALEQEGTDAGASGCGEAYNAAVQCARDSCILCITQAQSFPLYSACKKAAGMMGLCKSLETAQGMACLGYKNAGSPALECVPKGNEPDELSMTGISESFFTRIVAVTCGP